MYAKEMRNSQNRGKDTSGIDGDVDSKMPPPEKVLSTGLTPSSSDDDTFLFGYGHYGDPHSFAPYQLVLLLIDFVFNWTMDVTHEDPLAVLVIFVFQSLAIIINLILYIMASANRAMQVGLHKRVTIHHWLNLATCLLYMALTTWWFIWALRKSWPSVSDQFSFTWPAAGLAGLNGTLPLAPVNNSSGRNSGNATRKLTTGKDEGIPPNSQKSKQDEMVENLSLWSNGFIALYVCHRIIAIFYYFIFLRATFLVLNTPDIDKFLDKKNKLVEKFWEVKKAEKEEEISGKGRKKRSLLTNSYGGGDGPPQRSHMSLGLNEYLAGSAKFLMETEAGVGGSRHGGDVGGGRGENRANSNKKRQILWADDDDGVLRGEGELSGGVGTDVEEEEPKKSLSVRKAKSSKKSRTRRSEDKDEVLGEGQSRDVRHYTRDNGDEEDGENVRKVEKPRPRERTKQRRRASREDIEDADD